MKSAVFLLENPRFEDQDQEFQIVYEIYEIPILPAYAILNHYLDRKSNIFWGREEPIDYILDDNTVRISRTKLPVPSEVRKTVLTIHYSGIRDYKLLFPQIVDPELRSRIGQFAEEADKSFEADAWMSFSLMATSVIEGILYSYHGEVTYIDLINKSKDNNLINEKEAQLLHEARKTRNTIHASKFRDKYPDRLLCNDLYVLYDQLIKKNWINYVKKI